MALKSKKNVLVMLTNVGSTSIELNSLEEEPFIDKAKFAMKILVEKKIFLQPKDEIAIVTIGDKTDNPNEMDNVKLYCEHLLVPNWEIIKYINELESTNYSANWIEGLHVAVSLIEREVMNLNFGYNVFLVIIHDFKEDASSIIQYDADLIINQLNSYDNLHILFVGEKSLEEFSKNPNSSETFALTVLNNTRAQYEQLNSFIEQRKFYNVPPTNPTAWKFDLEWADMIIPCAEYIMTAEGPSGNEWKMGLSDSQDLVESSSNLDDLITMNAGPSKTNDSTINNTGAEKQDGKIVKQDVVLDHHRDEVSSDNIINGYRFGGKYIPLSEEDESAIKFEGTEKGMMIYGFVPQDQVKLEYWAGEGSRIIVPQTEEETTAFYSLVRAMVDQKYAAIVRKVYAMNNVPKMGVLFPKIDDDEVYGLVHLELPFAEDLRSFDKVPITSIEKEVSEEKFDALDDFIDAMTVNDNDEETDYLNPGLFPNVQDQYLYNAMADRALNKDAPLLPVNEYIKKYMEPPAFLKTKAKPYIEKLEKAFEECKNSYEVETKTSKKNKNGDVEIKPEVTSDISTVKAGGDEPVKNVLNEKNSKDEGIFSGDGDDDLKVEDFDDF